MSDFSSLLSLVWWGILFVCWGVVLIDAFKNGGGLHLLLCLVIPFYALYWVFFRQTMYRGIVVSLIGANVLLGVAVTLGWVGNRNDPCKLVTKADVEEALTQTVEEGKHTSTRNGTACRYTTVTEPKNTLEVLVTEDVKLKSMSDENLPAGAFKVENLGDDAVNIGATLHVQKGTAIVALSWKRGEGDQPSRSMAREAEESYGTLEARKKLARLALERYKP